MATSLLPKGTAVHMHCADNTGHNCCTSHNLNPKDPVGPNGQVSFHLLPHLTSFLFAYHTWPKHLLCARHSQQLETQSQVLWGLLVPATRGIPWKEAKSPCHSLFLWSLWIAVCSLETAVPCQGPGHSGFTHTLIYPNFQF